MIGFVIFLIIILAVVAYVFSNQEKFKAAPSLPQEVSTIFRATHPTLSHVIDIPKNPVAIQSVQVPLPKQPEIPIVYVPKLAPIFTSGSAGSILKTAKGSSATEIAPASKTSVSFAPRRHERYYNKETGIAEDEQFGKL